MIDVRRNTHISRKTLSSAPALVPEPPCLCTRVRLNLLWACVTCLSNIFIRGARSSWSRAYSCAIISYIAWVETPGNTHWKPSTSLRVQTMRIGCPSLHRDFISLILWSVMHLDIVVTTKTSLQVCFKYLSVARTRAKLRSRKPTTSLSKYKGSF